MVKRNDVYLNLKSAINNGTTVDFKYDASTKESLSKSYANLYRSYNSLGDSLRNGSLTLSQGEELRQNILIKKTRII